MAKPATCRWTRIFVLIGILLYSKGSQADPQPALSYWLLRAEDLAAEDKVAESKRAYKRALHLDPGNRFAVSGLLWLQVQDMTSPERGQEGGQGTQSRLTDGGKRKRLEYLLARFGKQAETDKELWRVYAVGYLLLEQPGAALPWFARGLSRQPADLLWLLDWAGALQRAGRPTLAHRVARRALVLLYPMVKKAAHKGQSALEHEAVRTFVKLLCYEKGPNNDTPRLLRSLLAGELDAVVSRELLTLWQKNGDRVDLLRTRIKSSADTAGLLLRLRDIPPPAPAVASTETNAVVKKKEAGSTAGKNDDDDDDDDDEDDGDDDDSAQADDSAQDESDDEEDGDTDDAAAAQVGGGPPAASSTTSDVEVETEELDSTRPFAVTVGGEAHGLGGLLVESLQARGDFSLHRLGLTLRLGYAHLSDSEDTVNLDNLGLHNGEFDLGGLGRFRLRKGKIELGVGGNLRAAQSLAYGTLHGDYDVGYGLSLEGNVGLNQVVDDTSRLRLAGVRDRVAAGVYYDLTQREFINLIADWHRYETRQRELLSDGYALYLEAGHRLLLSSPGWSVRVSGYFEQNRLVASLPAGLAAGLSLEDTEVSDVITPEFGMVGVGTTLRRGVPGVAPADDHRLRLFADLWMGYLWPLNDFGFDLQLGLGLSERGMGELSVSGFFSNSRSGGGSEGLSWGAGLRYVY
jgi:hypothetical protein